MSLETAVEAGAKKFESALLVIGKDFLKGLAVVEKFDLPVAALAGLIYPASVAVTTPAITALNVIQVAVSEVEQKYQAAGISGNGSQKLADALKLVSPAVAQILAEPAVAAELQKAGITVNVEYTTKLINAVVAILNAQPAQASS